MKSAFQGVLLGLVLASAALAEEGNSKALDNLDVQALDKLSLEELLEMPLSIGGGRQSTALDAPASVWVIDKELLRETPALSLYEILRLVPGTVLNQYSPGQVDHSFRFKGSFPENQTAVLLNGTSMLNEGLGIYEQQMLNLNDIESVEVVLGPASTLYGANAFSGVLNFVTRRPSRDLTRVWAQAQGGQGQGSRGREGDPLGSAPLGTGYVEGSTGWHTGGVKLSAGASYEPSFGFEGNLGRPAGITTPVRGFTSLLDLDQDLRSGWLLRLQATAASKSGPFELLDAADTHQQSYSTALKLSRPNLLAVGDELRLEAAVNAFRIGFQIESPGLSTAPSTLASNTGSLKAEYRPATFLRNNATVGMELRGSLLHISPEGSLEPWGQSQLAVSVYGEDSFRIVPTLLATAGVRLDTQEHPQDRPLRYFSASPRASLVWQFRKEQVLRLEYSSAFRTPTAIERAAHVLSTTGEELIVGNRDLQSERVHAFQLGYEGHWGLFVPRAEVYLARTIHNITVDFVPNGDPRTESQGGPEHETLGSNPWGFKIPYRYINLDAYWIPGATARLEFNPRPGFRTFLLYTYSPLGVQHSLSLNQYLTIGRTSASANFIFRDAEQGEQFWNIPGHVTLNARVDQALDAAGRWSVGLTALNLVDYRFRYRKEDPASPFLVRDLSVGEFVGLRLFATITYKLN